LTKNSQQLNTQIFRVTANSQLKLERKECKIYFAALLFSFQIYFAAANLNINVLYSIGKGYKIDFAANFVKIDFANARMENAPLQALSTEPQINRYFTAKRREASRLYNSRFRRDAMLRVSNYK